MTGDYYWERGATEDIPFVPWMVCGIGEISVSDQPCGGAKERGEATSVGSIAHMQPEDHWKKMGEKRRSFQGSDQLTERQRMSKGGPHPNHRNETKGI